MTLTMAKSILPAFGQAANAVVAPPSVDATRGLGNAQARFQANAQATDQMKTAGREMIGMQKDLAFLAAREMAKENLGFTGRPEHGKGLGSPAAHAGAMVGGSVAANAIGGVAQIADAVLGPVSTIAGAVSFVMAGNGAIQPSYTSTSSASDFSLFAYKDVDGGVFPSAMPTSQSFDNTVVTPMFAPVANMLSAGPKAAHSMKNPMEEEYRKLREDLGLKPEEILKQATQPLSPVQNIEHGLKARGEEMDNLLKASGNENLKPSFGSKSGQFSL